VIQRAGCLGELIGLSMDRVAGMLVTTTTSMVAAVLGGVVRPYGCGWVGACENRWVECALGSSQY